MGGEAGGFARGRPAAGGGAVRHRRMAAPPGLGRGTRPRMVAPMAAGHGHRPGFPGWRIRALVPVSGQFHRRPDLHLWRRVSGWRQEGRAVFRDRAAVHGGDARRDRRGRFDADLRLLGADEPDVVPVGRLQALRRGGAQGGAAGAAGHRRGARTSRGVILLSQITGETRISALAAHSARIAESPHFVPALLLVLAGVSPSPRRFPSISGCPARWRPPLR